MNWWIMLGTFTGVMAVHETTKDEKYLDTIFDWGTSHSWAVAPVDYADDLLCAQTYLDVYFLRGDPDTIAPVREHLDWMLTNPTPGRELWYWCDALFMAPAVFPRLALATGNDAYIDHMDQMWWDTTDFLFDEAEGLYYRDAKYFDKVTANGFKVFWSRGNGWVLAGTARVLQHLPKDYPNYAHYVDLFTTMSASVAAVQGQEFGLWTTGLLDSEEFPHPETSGSGFYCYAMAWGINNGILDRGEYLPTVLRAWRGLVGAVYPDGKLGWVQGVAQKPGVVEQDHTEVYAVGAFLLAGSEVHKLALRSATASVQTFWPDAY